MKKTAKHKASTPATHKPVRQTVRMRRRATLVALTFIGLAGVLVWRAVDLQVLRNEFLLAQGAARYLRVVEVSAHRGMIVDRNGEPLAVSTPVDSLWMNPQDLVQQKDAIEALAEALQQPVKALTKTVTESAQEGREFVYLERHMNPAQAEAIMALELPGVHSQREYRRYYPAGEVTAPLIGFTNIDGKGLEGLELAYNKLLDGEPGAKRVLKDRLGRYVENVESIRAPQPGKTLTTSINLGIQYLAYRELKTAVQQHGAKSGSVVVLDARTNEVLAMVSQPSYNPNNRAALIPGIARNRAVTDIFEPGSSFKPFPIAAALESGRFEPHTPINTSPGYIKVGNFVVADRRNYGLIDVTKVLTKSINSGATRIALSLDPRQLWSVLARLGFGTLTGSGFPGEQTGQLRHYTRWQRVGQATLAYGYGVSVTPLQLAQGYSVIAANGVRRPISLVKLEEPPTGQQVLTPETARELRTMLETVTTPEGTGTAAAIAGYHVAGKTGTARKAADGGYDKNRHVAVFAGLAPATRPRLICVVVINEPTRGGYHGGQVAAPVFHDIMAGALRLLDIPPDDLEPRQPPAGPVIVAAQSMVTTGSAQ
ncbi:MAG TPA: penicillin-binding transpeptidase domain-containing protein [Gammaproteobacteria bacterium]|nr:penicillin-binding transpeptidase domain-containing protein [Gammaproteobacteria bacterium]